MNSGAPLRVGLIGAGNIADVHAEALTALKLPISAIVDPRAEVRDRLARKYKIAASFTSVDEAISADAFDRAHVLVPPDLHAAIAAPLLRAGKAVLAEKPLATSRQDCELLTGFSSGTAILGVNQNFVYHPAFAKLREAAAKHALGVPRFLNMVYHAPLRQMASRQFGHWMFRQPRNILLEQAVHPLSQIMALCGEIGAIQAVGDAPTEIAPGVDFYSSFTASLSGQHLPASFRFAVGQNFPFWQVSVICDDGLLVADMLTNQFWEVTRTRWLDPLDHLLRGFDGARSTMSGSFANFKNYGLSMLGLAARSDGFYISMRESIRAFHAAADQMAPPLSDGRFGSALVGICDRIADQIMPAPRSMQPPVPKLAGDPDIAVLGGTGFIGTALVKRLRADGLTVAVMARNIGNLPAIFQDGGVTVHRGDIGNPEQVAAAIRGASVVVNLAHGGGSGSWEEIRDAMLGGVQNVAISCQKAQISKLVHVGSIASLYLGSQNKPVTGNTPPDKKAEERAFYSRAKAMSDEYLMQLHSEGKLSVCVLRPGLVVGAGTSPFHSGLGFFNNEQHCIGWNEGRNPLPFVLVNDVADAILSSTKEPRAYGAAFNLVGDVRPTARVYIEALGQALHRPLKFHPKNPYMLYADELGKWAIKRIAGRKVPLPSLRDILSRGLKADFDCKDVKETLQWAPANDPQQFFSRAFDSGG
ncbi:MAG: NAD-dependent epimerase/dehydratase family protein [Alphaproteobacteria bacterium]|nr:NAD-dependent epimerase/dehydratase family protein [Alphaproteobacteria bacterium]